MSYCPKCGTYNANNKYCTNCGYRIIGNDDTTTESEKHGGRTSVPVDKQKYLYIGIIALACTFFAFLLYSQLRKPSATSQFAKAEAKNQDDTMDDIATTSDEPPTVNSGTAATASTTTTSAKQVPNTSEAVSESATSNSEKPQPGKVSHSEANFTKQKLEKTYASGTLTQTELETLSNVMNGYFADDNAFNLSVLDYFEYPIKKYYTFTDLSYSRLYDMYGKSAKRFAYHKLTPYLSTSEVGKDADGGYTVTVNADYTWETHKTPGVRKTRSQKLYFKLNNSYKITKVYEL